MNGWRYLLANNVVAFMMGCTARDRVRLFKLIRELIANPYVEPEFMLRDDVGRDISFITRERFHIGFWLDHFVKEMRVVELERAN